VGVIVKNNGTFFSGPRCTSQQCSWTRQCVPSFRDWLLGLFIIIITIVITVTQLTSYGILAAETTLSPWQPDCSWHHRCDSSPSLIEPEDRAKSAFVCPKMSSFAHSQYMIGAPKFKKSCHCNLTKGRIAPAHESLHRLQLENVAFKPFPN